jgi:ectoine hydroxylase-related dioxygenase (phytanoyl-CoA dioxygenase family)
MRRYSEATSNDRAQAQRTHPAGYPVFSYRPQTLLAPRLHLPGDYPLSTNIILYLQDMDDEIGPTYVLPGSHRGWRQPPADEAKNHPLKNEVPVLAQAGDAAVINAAVLHSGGINTSADRHRRNLYMYYGHWWLKRYQSDQDLPWQCLENASPERLQLLGRKAPGDLHIYPADAKRNGPA